MTQYLLFGATAAKAIADIIEAGRAAAERVHEGVVAYGYATFVIGTMGNFYLEIAIF